MHILLLTDGLYPFVLGGMQKHSSILTKMLKKRGVELTVVHCGGEAYSKERFVEEFGDDINEVFIPFEDNSVLPGHYLRASERYAKNIAFNFSTWTDFDLVYVQGFCGIDLNTEHINVPILLNLHGLEMFQQYGTGLKSRLDAYVLRRYAKRAINHADYVYSFGGKIDGLFSRLNILKEQILHQTNGIKTDWVLDREILKRECRRFVFIGRNERRKGLTELKEAINTLGEKNFCFDFIGPIDNRGLNKTENITIHGEQRDKSYLMKVLDNCDCLICPSYAEGMPTVIAEAMARGLAIIATDVGAVSRQFNNNGILLESPEPKLIADAMKRLMHLSAEDFYQLRARSLEKAKNEFTWENIIESKIRDFKIIIAQN